MVDYPLVRATMVTTSNTAKLHKGFTCTSTIVDAEWQLDADHINGVPTDNRPENIQTLCKCCHAIKTRDEKDYLTAGRKTLKRA
jgi:hypothetical protein